jgi:hypothetical protein
MTRSARRLPWRLLIGVLALVMLGVVVPRTWQPGPAAPRTLHRNHASPPRAAADSRPRLAPPAASPSPASAPQPAEPPAAELVVAPVGPLVAEQIDLDPSLPETPAIPEEKLTLEPLPMELEPTLTASRNNLHLNNASTSIQPKPVDPLEAEPQVEPREAAPPPELGPEADPLSDFRETKAWPYPAGLIEQLNVLSATTPAAVNWAERVKQELELLVTAESLDDGLSAQQLAALARLAEEGRMLASSLPEEQGRSRVLRCGYSIYRRLNVWDRVHSLALRGESSGPPQLPAWNEAAAAAEERLQATGAAANWRAYLLLDRAASDFDSPACAPEDQQRLARDILYRLNSTQLSQAQTQFLCSQPFAAMTEYLTARAATTADLIGLLTTIEDHEHDDASRHARALADQYDVLRWSNDPAVRDLAETVNSYYRNANVRVALSAELINRMIPPQQPQVEMVQDKILGADVYGQSYTNTQLRLVLIPDEQRWNVGLEANGAVSSDTTSEKGPARFLQKGISFFRARKRVTVDQQGIRVFNAEAGANANNELEDFETRFDFIPLFGDIARSFVRSQYDESQPAAREVVEGKIRVRATSQLDREVATKLEQGKRDFESRFIKPLQELDLEPTTVDMETTLERLIGRMRLAARDQIAAHTPRPQAPGDSVLSVQLHESAFNNALENLELEGRKVELHELFTEMTNRFDPTPDPVPEELPEDVYVTFADEDAVRIDCQDGRVRLTIKIKELSHKRSRWRNFTVRGYYAPNADQLDANLVREGIIELIGEELTFGNQLSLRTIFTRVLSKNRKLSLVNKQIAESPELRDQQVTQFVIHDGWIGIALGPKSAGREPAMYPRPPVEEAGEQEAGE